MRKSLLVLFSISIVIILAACSNDSAQINTEESKIADSEEDSAGTGSGDSDNGKPQKKSKEAQGDRKIIYTANLRIEVKDYQKALNDIQNQVVDRGGYVVESLMSESAEDDSTSGMITARVPQDKFREFVQLVEDGSSKVLESSISGDDVTEEYIDLESRLKSKRVVEKRLLNFMEKAEKTEDLLKISDDLATVQGKMEEITGRMNYLENKVNLATVTIHIQENKVKVSGINDEERNTWEKTKQQFMKSINFLISAFSGLFVFIIGNLPVLIPLAAIALGTFLIVRKSRKKGK